MTTPRSLALGLALAAGPVARAAAQTTFDACYVPSVGAIYLIKQAGLPSACLAQAHAQFTWTSGGVIADGSVQTAMLADGAVTPAKLSFNPATQTELNALATAGTINNATNPVDWTQLKNVPAGFADGTDGGGVAAHGALTGLADDDHTQYLLVNGVRDAVDGFAVTGRSGVGVIPVSGRGNRLMWYSGKGAFRAGRTEGTEWEDVVIGSNSIAMGQNTTASGLASTALGHSTTASAGFSTALGYLSEATASSATAMGSGTLASGSGSTALGSGTIASGDYSTATGVWSTAAAFASVTIGMYNVVTGSQTSWQPAEPLFVAGNGPNAGARSNALTLFKNGNMTISGTLTQSSDLRFKEGIESLEFALNGVLDLRPIRYRFREGTGHPTDPQIGLGAQDVERVFPELVHRDSQGQLSVAYTQLTAVLVRAIQEQQQMIETLRAEIAALQSQRR